MKNINTAKLFLIRACAVFLLINATYTFAAGVNIFGEQSFSAKSKNLISEILNTNKSLTNTTSSAPEIWSRVRGRLNLNTPSSRPLFQKHIRNYSKSQDQIDLIVRNASPFLYYILEEVEKRGMPAEIALLPMIESEFNPHCISHKGASGLWQIMPQLGRLHGLKQNKGYDGRRDIYASTKVALDHLEYLHERFNGNWLLALAAYNSGEYRVLKAIKKNKSAKISTDFWSLKLPKETMHYVPKLLAISAIIKFPKQYGVSLPVIPNKPVIAQITPGKSIDIAHAAKLADISESQLRKLNPGLHKNNSTVHPDGPFKLVVPIQRVGGFTQKINTSSSSSLIKADSVSKAATEVKKNPAKKKTKKKKTVKTKVYKSKAKKTKTGKKGKRSKKLKARNKKK